VGHMPLYMTVPLGVVIAWTLVLWVLAAYYGYVCPAPWFENEQKRRGLPRAIRRHAALVNAAGSFDKATGRMGRFANSVRHDSPPGFPQVGEHMFPRSAFFDALKSDDRLEWKPR
jgi:hypothetical protein